MKSLLTVKEVAKGLGYSSATIRSLIRNGKLTHIKFSERDIRVPRNEVDRLLEFLGPEPIQMNLLDQITV